ncbi:MAG: hypothetical protein MRZ17_01185 [Acholeplasmataceae bacterium]|nr:hypothetical protein [Acholeplasmataceae bacterium]
MGSFISTSPFVELPFRGEKKKLIGNVISFDENATDEEVINTIINAKCDRIQATKEPNKSEISILNEIYRIKPDIGFRFLIMFGPDVDISFLLKINNLRTIYLDSHPNIMNIDIIKKMKLDKLVEF